MSDLIAMLADAQPDTWEACCRLYAADCAERALTLYGGEVDPRSIEFVRVVRLYAHGRATDEELKAARDDARDAARSAAAHAHTARHAADAWITARCTADLAVAAADAAWATVRVAAGWDAAGHAAEAAGLGVRAAWYFSGDRAAELRAQRDRLLQYVEHGVEAENMRWPEIAGGEE